MKKSIYAQERIRDWMLMFFLVVSVLPGCGSANDCLTSAGDETETPTNVSQASEPVLVATTKICAQGQQVKCKWISAVCDPPCWEGIVPGETTLEQALGLLRESVFVERSTIREGVWLGGVWPGKTQILWNDIGWETSEDILISNGYPNMLLAKDGIVEWVLLRFDVTTQCSPTVREVIERYGIPEKILRGEAGYTPETMWGEMDLLYPSQGLVFASLTTGHRGTVLQEDHIRTAYYFVPTSLDTLIAQPIQFDFQRWYREFKDGKIHFIWAEKLEDWPGFTR